LNITLLFILGWLHSAVRLCTTGERDAARHQ
jgi:hypothetical protein